MNLTIKKIEKSTVHFEVSVEADLELTFKIYTGHSQDFLAYSAAFNVSGTGSYWIAHPCLICFSKTILSVCDKDDVLLGEYPLENLDSQNDHAINFLGRETYDKIEPYLNLSYAEFFQEGKIDSAGLNSRSPFVFENCKNVVDLGSNIGFFGKYIRRHTTLDNYICVEPNENFNYPNEVLNEGLAKNHKIYNSVFYDKDDLDIKYYMAKEPIDWSISTIDTDFKDEFSKNSEFNEETRPTISLKRIIEENDLEIIDFLKVDIEGAEKYLLEPDNFEILKNKVKYISVEVHSKELRAKFAKVFDKDEFRIESTHSIHFQINNIKLTSEDRINNKKLTNVSKKLLLRIHSNAMGDSLSATPTVRKVSQSYGCKVFVQTHQPNIFKNNPYIEKVYSFNDEVKDSSFDEVFNTHNHWIKTSLGDTSKIYGEPMEIKLGNFEARQVHALAIGTSLYPEEMHYDFCADKPTKNSEKINKDFLTFHVTDNWPSRTWGVENWQKLVDLIKSNTDFKIATVGKSHKEHTFNGHLDKRVVDLDNIDFNFCIDDDQLMHQQDLEDGSGSISELWHFINNSFALVSFDSGPIHIAGTTDSNIVLIGSSLRPEKSLPYRNGTQDYKAFHVGGKCSKACASDIKYSVKEWGTINSMPYLPACQEKYDNFDCQPTPEQIFSKICEIKELEI